MPNLVIDWSIIIHNHQVQLVDSNHGKGSSADGSAEAEVLGSTANGNSGRSGRSRGRLKARHVRSPYLLQKNPEPCNTYSDANGADGAARGGGGSGVGLGGRLGSRLGGGRLALDGGSGQSGGNGGTGGLDGSVGGGLGVSGLTGGLGGLGLGGLGRSGGGLLGLDSGGGNLGGSGGGYLDDGGGGLLGLSSSAGSGETRGAGSGRETTLLSGAGDAVLVVDPDLERVGADHAASVALVPLSVIAEALLTTKGDEET